MTTIKIDGVDYDLPENVNLGEARIIEKYTEGNVEGEGYGVAKLMGLIHVAVVRVRPELSFEEVRSRIEKLEIGELDALIGDDASPPETLPASGHSGETSNGSSGASSDASPEKPSPGSTGVPPSDTGSTSLREISAA